MPKQKDFPSTMPAAFQSLGYLITDCVAKTIEIEGRYDDFVALLASGLSNDYFRRRLIQDSRQKKPWTSVVVGARKTGVRWDALEFCAVILSRGLMVTAKSPGGLSVLHQGIEAVSSLADRDAGVVRSKTAEDTIVHPGTLAGQLNAILSAGNAPVSAGSASFTWIDRFGPVWLAIDDAVLPVPEEPSLAQLVQMALAVCRNRAETVARLSYAFASCARSAAERYYALRNCNLPVATFHDASAPSIGQLRGLAELLRRARPLELAGMSRHAAVHQVWGDGLPGFRGNFLDFASTEWGRHALKGDVPFIGDDGWELPLMVADGRSSLFGGRPDASYEARAETAPSIVRRLCARGRLAAPVAAAVTALLQHDGLDAAKTLSEAGLKRLLRDDSLRTVLVEAFPQLGEASERMFGANALLLLRDVLGEVLQAG